MGINTRNASVTVGTSPVVVSEQKISGYSERVRLIVANTSTGGQVINLSVDADPVVGQGIVLYPGGSQVWEKQTFPVQQKRVMAISNLAGGSLSLYEEVEQ